MSSAITDPVLNGIDDPVLNGIDDPVLTGNPKRAPGIFLGSASTVPNRLSAEPWLRGDNRLGRLNLWGGAAWLSGLVVTLVLLPE